VHPEDTILHSHRRENLKSYNDEIICSDEELSGRPPNRVSDLKFQKTVFHNIETSVFTLTNFAHTSLNDYDN
jgi:hypothetical protein